jgi:Domain of unknown function (DUF4384)
MRAKLWAAGSLAFVVAAGSNLPAGPRADDMKFAWAVGALTGPAEARQSVAVKGEVTLKTGDELKIFISQVTPSFAYVLHEDTKREFEVFYPEGSFSKSAAASKGSHYIPPEDWFKLDEETGLERIYLVASTTRLTALEQLLDEYASVKAAARSGVPTRIITELARLDKQHATPPWSERPVTMGGQVRGPKPPKPDVALNATEVTAPGYFSRVLVIDHR